MGLATMAGVEESDEVLTKIKLFYTLENSLFTVLCHNRAFLSFKTWLRQSILIVGNEPHTRCSVSSHHIVMCRETDMPLLKVCLLEPHLNVIVYHHVYPSMLMVEYTITENLPSS